MEFYHAKDLRSGYTFKFKNNLYVVIENSFNKTAMREGIVKCKVKNLRTGSITVEILTGEKLEKVIIEKIKATYLYHDQTSYFFMDNESFEQFGINKNQLVNEIPYLVEDTTVTIMRYGDEFLGVIFPDRLKVVVDKTEDAVQGNTVHSVLKSAWLSNGFEIKVPLFVKSGEEILINPKTGEYISRSEKK